MRWATYRSPTDGREHTAVVHEGALYALPADLALIQLLDGSGPPLEAAASWARAQPYEVVDPDAVELLAPIPRPPAVRDYLSFENHYRDTREGLGLQIEPLFYEQPSFYFTNPAAIIGPDADVAVAPGTEQWDYELEIAAVIGQPGADLTVDEAEAHIAGYTVFCDWSARDLQAKDTVFGTGPGKGKDTASSLGPYLVTPDEIELRRSGLGFDLAMTAWVNGVQYTDGNWNTVSWSMAELLSFASRGTQLRPGDVVATGTVGTGCIMELGAVHGHDQDPWLVPGDEVRMRVELLGEVVGRIVPSPAPAPLR